MMRLYKSYRKLSFVAAVLCIFYIAPLHYVYLFPQRFEKCVYLGNGFLFFFLFLFFLPFGSPRFAFDKSNVKPFLKVLLFVWLIEAGAFFVFMSAVYYCRFANPQLEPPSFLTFNLSHWLYPWTLIAIAAGLLHYFAYVKNAPGMISSGTPVFRDTFRSAFFRRIFTYVSFGTTMSFVVGSLIISVFLLATLSANAIGFPLRTGVNVVTVMFAVVMFFVLYGDDTDKVLAFFARHRLPLGALSFLGGVIIYFVLVLFAVVTQSLSVITHLDVAQSTLLLKTSVSTHWLLFYFGWWAIATPLLGSMLAQVCRQLSCRATMFSVAIGPALLIALQIIFPFFHRGLHQLLTSHLFIWLSGLSFVIISFLMIKAHDSRFMLTGWLPCQTNQRIVIPMKLKRFLKPALTFLAVLSAAISVLGPYWIMISAFIASLFLQFLMAAVLLKEIGLVLIRRRR
ncbi:MAG: BCCT family transporter [Gammaproteobacteria bacterium]